MADKKDKQKLRVTLVKSPIACRAPHRETVRGLGLRRLHQTVELEDTPAVCLFVRAENAAAIRLYEAVGMHHVLDYRSVLL